MKDTLNQLHSKYWVTQGRRTVNRVIQKCTKCSKFDSKAFKLLPAILALCHIYDDDIDDVLTPSHLLFGRLLLTESVENVSPENTSEEVSRRTKYIHTILQHFWRRWSFEYLTELREHHNCHKSVPEKQIKLGDVVLIHDKLPRNRWKMGLVLELFEGKDGLVRGGKLRTLSKSERISHMNRPINKLYPLEIPSENVAESQNM